MWCYALQRPPSSNQYTGVVRTIVHALVACLLPMGTPEDIPVMYQILLARQASLHLPHPAREVCTIANPATSTAASNRSTRAYLDEMSANPSLHALLVDVT